MRLTNIILGVITVLSLGAIITADVQAQNARRTVDFELSNGKLQFRNNLGLVDAGAVANQKLSASAVKLPVAAPASASAPCSPGQFAISTTAISVCTATNTWKSVALGTFTP